MYIIYKKFGNYFASFLFSYPVLSPSYNSNKLLSSLLLFCSIYFKFYILSETTLSSFYIQEHEKRCWSVDFNLMDPKLLASGSDDAKGTIWITFLFLPPPLFLLLLEIQIFIEIYSNLLWLLIVPKITTPKIYITFGMKEKGIYYIFIIILSGYMLHGDIFVTNSFIYTIEGTFFSDAFRHLCILNCIKFPVYAKIFEYS